MLIDWTLHYFSSALVTSKEFQFVKQLVKFQQEVVAETVVSENMEISVDDDVKKEPKNEPIYSENSASLPGIPGDGSRQGPVNFEPGMFGGAPVKKKKKEKKKHKHKHHKHKHGSKDKKEKEKKLEQVSESKIPV